MYFVIQKVAPQFISNNTVKPSNQNFPTAPDFILKDTNNKIVKLADLRGKAVILYFWTSWNNVSAETLKTVSDYSSYLSADAALLTINNLENKSVAEKIGKDQGINAPILIDDEGLVGELYNITTLPLLVFINKNGQETGRFIGPATAQDIEKGLAAAKTP